MNTSINMDFAKRVVIEAISAAWVDSAATGVQRKMLERENAESGRATTIVRFAPGSEFAAHTHVGGEEFFVLDGEFSDEFGDFGPGMYVRNPVGSTHQPKSPTGCTIFVKLGQMDPEDQSTVRFDTNAAAWQPGPVDGQWEMPLHHFKGETISLVKLDAGTELHRNTHPGGEEVLVLEGRFEDEQGSYPRLTWVRNPRGGAQRVFSRSGATLLVKSGHLAPPDGQSAKPRGPWRRLFEPLETGALLI